MLIQTNAEQRIIVEEDLKVNNSPLKFKLAFLNQEIKIDAKNVYYKLLIWFVGNNYVRDFDFNLFLKSQNQQIAIPLENLQPNFQPNNQNYLIAKIPSSIFNSEADELTYSFVHNQLFTGQGKIFLNLKNNSEWKIDNELIFYENQKSINLIVRILNWEIPEFYFNQHYKKILGLQYETKNYSFQINLDPVQQMANLVQNNTWTIPLEFLNLKIESENLETKKYVFTPNYEVWQKNYYFKINLLNCLSLNSEGQIVEDDRDEKVGLLMNPLIAKRQVVKVQIKTFSLMKEFSFWINLPELKPNSHFQGEWIAV